MSVERVARRDGTKVWRVLWRDEQGRNRSKTLGRKRDAEGFDAEIRRLRRLGELGIMDTGRVTLAEFGQEWLVAHAIPNLEPKTLRTYESLWDRPRPAEHRRHRAAPAAPRLARPPPRAAAARRPLARQCEEGRRTASGRPQAGRGVGAHRAEPDAPGAEAEGPPADRDPPDRSQPRSSSSGGTSSPTAGCVARRRVRARLLGATTR
jgi:hypothetical protein